MKKYRQSLHIYPSCVHIRMKRGRKKLYHENVFLLRYFIRWWPLILSVLYNFISLTLFAVFTHTPLVMILRLPLVFRRSEIFSGLAQQIGIQLWIFPSQNNHKPTRHLVRSRKRALRSEKEERRKKNFDWMKYKSKQQAVEYIQYLSCSQRWNINERASVCTCRVSRSYSGVEKNYILSFSLPKHDFA